VSRTRHCKPVHTPCVSDERTRHGVPSLPVRSLTSQQFPNYLADKMGPVNAVIPCCMMTGVVGFSWIAVHDRAGVIAFCIFYGFWSGAFVSLTP